MATGQPNSQDKKKKNFIIIKNFAVMISFKDLVDQSTNLSKMAKGRPLLVVATGKYPNGKNGKCYLNVMDGQDVVITEDIVEASELLQARMDQWTQGKLPPKPNTIIDDWRRGN